MLNKARQRVNENDIKLLIYNTILALEWQIGNSSWRSSNPPQSISEIVSETVK